MTFRDVGCPAAAALLLVLASPAGAAEGRAGGQLELTEPVAEDLYAAAGTILLTAAVDGDAVLAGGSVTVSGDVAGDALLAGGTIDIDGVVGDDLRTAGGNITLRGLVTDQAIVAGGAVTLGPESAVGGRAWLAGNTVAVEGQLGGNLKVTAGTVRVSGQIEGDAEITARAISIEPGARIAGNLVWRSPVEPDIAPEAEILGNVVGGEVPADAAFTSDTSSAGTAGRLLLGAALFLAAATLWWLFPWLVSRASAELRAAPGRTLLAGVVTFFATPFVIFVLFLTLVGWLLAFALLAGYSFALASTGLLALAALADLVAGRGTATAGWGRRLGLLLVVTAATVLLQGVPGVGWLVTVFLWVAGLGMVVGVLRGPRATLAC
jgi:cytoskeletal protein CcmA (bactofilin family)